MIKFILRQLCISRIKYLQRKYKSLTEYALRGHQSNRTLSRLKFINAELYHYKSQFHAWGYFHPSCAWSKSDEIHFNKLFPKIDFKEVEIVVWHRPDAVTYYQNKIYTLSKGSVNYESEIIAQLKKWDYHR